MILNIFYPGSISAAVGRLRNWWGEGKTVRRRQNAARVERPVTREAQPAFGVSMLPREQQSRKRMSNLTTAQIMRRFNQAFLEHDLKCHPDFVAKDSAMEPIRPAPDGTR
jgi:hypothetical protein